MKTPGHWRSYSRPDDEDHRHRTRWRSATAYTWRVSGCSLRQMDGDGALDEVTGYDAALIGVVWNEIAIRFQKLIIPIAATR